MGVILAALSGIWSALVGLFTSKAAAADVSELVADIIQTVQQSPTMAQATDALAAAIEQKVKQAHLKIVVETFGQIESALSTSGPLATQLAAETDVSLDKVGQILTGVKNALEAG